MPLCSLHSRPTSIYMKEWQMKFYGSRRWKNLRKTVWTRDHGLCQRCMEKGIIRPGTTVHHKIELNESNYSNENISLNPDNLITLCRDCHAAIHRKNNKRYTVDELGRVIIKD